MDRQQRQAVGGTPTLEPGVTTLIGDRRSTAPHRIALATLRAEHGQAIWIDAGDTASTYTLHTVAQSARQLDGIAIARAWTAYQHHTLVKQAISRVSSRTRLLVAPNVCSLYRDNDLAEDEANQLLAATLRLLAELAETVSIPVLVTARESESAVLEPLADHELIYKQTVVGDIILDPTDKTTGYHGHGWWQTTIPYWVDLLGERADSVRIIEAMASPVQTPLGA